MSACYQLGDRSGSTKFLSMKTSPTLGMTLPCYDLVRKVLLVILFLTNPFNNQLTEERVDLSVFSPVCLPGLGESFVDQNGHVYGKQHQPMQTIINPDLIGLCIRLGSHWSSRDLHRQAARDCSSHCRKQQLWRRCGRRPDCVCGW